jgi:fructosamine-3-kinase
VRIAGIDLLDPQPVGGGYICRAFSAHTPDGRAVFAKNLSSAPAGFFDADVRGLRWLTSRDGPPVPEVIGHADDGLVLEWVEPAPPSDRAAREFGRRLAAMHVAGAEHFGAGHDGYIGSLPLPNAPADDWPTFYAEQRLRPFLSLLTAAQRKPVEQVCGRLSTLAGPPEPPARLHGDLWSGNLLWAADSRVWLVDAGAAHGGHRETDLAMLALFGAPHLRDILTSYDAAAPLAPGWRQRVGLHQLHPLLVHATLFGGGYGDRAASLARSLLDR